MRTKDLHPYHLIMSQICYYYTNPHKIINFVIKIIFNYDPLIPGSGDKGIIIKYNFYNKIYNFMRISVIVTYLTHDQMIRVQVLCPHTVKLG